jgi:N-acetylglucosamine malate deacetylase 2
VEAGMHRKIVLVFAHPDDESYGTGGTIYRYASTGTEIHLITATNGEGSKHRSPDKIGYDLGGVRKNELYNAGKILGIRQIHFLEYPDRLLSTIPRGELEASIKRILIKIRPQVVITFDKNGVTGHPDHKAISRATTNAFFKTYLRRSSEPPEQSSPFPKLYYLTFPKSWLSKLSWSRKILLRRKYRGTADQDITTKIDISAFTSIKIEACKCHKTQLTSFHRLTRYIGLKYFEKEYFLLANSRTFPLGVEKRENDLFEGLTGL